MRLIRPILLLTLALACRTPGGRVESIPARGGFVVTLGNDTVSAESYTRTGGVIEGLVMRRVPRTAVVNYRLTLDAAGRPSRLEYTTRLPDGGLLPGGAQSVEVSFAGDSATTRIVRDSVTVIRAAAPNAYPEIDGAVSLYALPIAALERMQRDSARFVAYPAGAPAGDPTPVARRGDGRYTLYSSGYPIEIVTDEAGAILSVDATATTFRVRAVRQATVDVAALAREFARREAITGPVTALSLRDTVRATVGGVNILVDYGRPAARGRRIWGPNGVLGDTLWRTGANQSTQLRIAGPIVLGGQSLAAGNYNVMTLAIPGRYQLIVLENGTERLRVPLEPRPLSPNVERFTIAIDAAGSQGALLRLQWDTLELVAPIVVP